MSISTDAGMIILFSAIFGMLAGIVWSLRYIVLLEKRIQKIEVKIEKMLIHVTELVETARKKKK